MQQSRGASRVRSLSSSELNEVYRLFSPVPSGPLDASAVDAAVAIIGVVESAAELHLDCHGGWF